jgi:hypothetical protein
VKRLWLDCTALLGAAAALFFGLRKALLMFDIIKKAWAIIALCVLAVEMENQTPGAGAAKKQEACKRIKEALDPLLPDWLNPVVLGLTPMLIDAIVALANRTGFFAQLGSGSSS